MGEDDALVAEIFSWFAANIDFAYDLSDELTENLKQWIVKLFLTLYAEELEVENRELKGSYFTIRE